MFGLLVQKVEFSAGSGEKRERYPHGPLSRMLGKFTPCECKELTIYQAVKPDFVDKFNGSIAQC